MLIKSTSFTFVLFTFIHITTEVDRKCDNLMIKSMRLNIFANALHLQMHLLLILQMHLHIFTIVNKCTNQVGIVDG